MAGHGLEQPAEEGMINFFFKEKNSALIENLKFRSSTQADWGTSLQYAKKKRNEASTETAKTR